MQNIRQAFSYPKNLYPFASKWINVKGVRIHYIDEGKGETILFCHPPITSSFMYRYMIADLSKHFRCIAMDFPGFGLSERNNTESLSIDLLSEIVERLLNYLQLKSVYLLMQECGGHAAMKIFLEQPEKLRGVIITDTVVFPISGYPRIKNMLSFINGRVFNFINTNFNFLIRAMTRFGIQKRKLSSEEKAVYKKMFRSKSTRSASTHLLYQLLTEEELLRQIQNAFDTTFKNIPALIIYGEKDPLTELKVPQRIHAMLSNSQLYFIDGEAHFPHEGAPEEMNAIIRMWFTSTVTSSQDVTA